MVKHSLLRVENIYKSFGKERVLNGVSFSLQQGEILCLVGPSGCGKSTLLRCINGLEKCDTGQIYLSGAPLCGVSSEKTRHIREKIGVVFQHFNLFSHLNIIDNIALGPLKVKKESEKEAYTRAKKLLQSVGLGEKTEAYPSELSGGQQQRVATARALAMEPQLLLFDEPTSALDPEMICDVLDVIKNIAKKGATMIIVTHEMAFARQIAHRMIFLENGKILADSSPAHFFGNNSHTRIQCFLKRLPDHHDFFINHYEKKEGSEKDDI